MACLLSGRVSRFSWQICRFLQRSLPMVVRRSSSGIPERWVTAYWVHWVWFDAVTQKIALSMWQKNVTLARRIYYLAQFHFQHGERLGFVQLIWKIKRPMQVLCMLSQGFYKAFQTGSHVPSGFSRIISSNRPHERNANRQSHTWFHLSPLHCLSVCMGNETPAEKFQRTPWNPCTEA